MQKRITKRTRLAQKKRKKNILLSLAALVLLIIAYAGLGWGLSHEKVTITTVHVVDNDVVDAEALVTTVRQGFGVTRGLLLYGGTIFTYDKSAIVADLLYTYPRLKSVTLKAKKIDTLELTVVEREAVAQWCSEKEANLEVELPSCYLLDEDGFVFERIDSRQNGLIVYKGDLAGEALRQNLLHDDFARVQDFVNKLKIEVDINVNMVILLDGEFEVQSEDHPLLKIKLDDNLKRVLSYVQVTLDSQEYKDFVNEETTEGAKEHYIDLRFGNRVYYK